MSDRTRREFIRTITALLAASKTGLGGASILSGRGKTGEDPDRVQAPAPDYSRWNGIQMSPHTMLYQGIDRCLDLLAEEAAVNVIMPYSHAFHTSTLGKPVNSLASHFGEEKRDFRGIVPSIWVRHNEEFFSNTSLRPRPTDPDLEFAENDLFQELLEPARERGMKIFPRVLEASGAHIENFDRVRTVDAYGNRGRHACFSHPEYREFWAACVRDMFTNYELDGFQWGAERMGPLMNVVLPWNDDAPTCYCEHCLARVEDANIDPERAKEGFTKLYEYVRGLIDGEPEPAEGVFTIFLRHLIQYPEILSWQYQFRLSREELQRDIYNAIKEIKPDAEVGWHVDHQPSSWDMVFRAEMSYEEMAPHSDFIKLILYHEVLAPRIRSWYLERFQRTILRELSLKQSLQIYYALFGYDSEKEPALEDMRSQGFSPNYVYRETKRSVASAGGATDIIAGIGIDVPGSPPDHPDRVYEATLGAFEGGARGILISREYEEMEVENLAAVGRAVREWESR
ncbi:MAG: hypothetical protein WDZ29_00790 [Balneolaceae bacterium]